MTAERKRIKALGGRGILDDSLRFLPVETWNELALEYTGVDPDGPTPDARLKLSVLG